MSERGASTARSGLVDGGERGLAGEDGEDVAAAQLDHCAACFRSCRSEVREEHDVGGLGEPGRELRFALEDVEAGRGEVRRSQRADERTLVDQWTARSVDEDRTGPHPGQ